MIFVKRYDYRFDEITFKIRRRGGYSLNCVLTDLIK